MVQRLDVPGGHPRPTVARGRRRWLKWTITLLVVIGLLVAADFGLAAAAEYQVSKTLRSQLGLAHDPQVMVYGFPFITQALEADYKHISIDANGVHAGDSFRNLQIHADLHHVRVHLSDILGGSLKQIPIDDLAGSVAVKADDISRLVDNSTVGKKLGLSDLTIDPATLKEVVSDDTDSNSGKDDEDSDQKSEPQYKTTTGVRFGTNIQFAGKKTWVFTFGLINLVDGKIQVLPKRMKLSNDAGDFVLPDAIQHTLLQNFALTIDPGSLPFKATPLGVAVQPGSMSVQGEAKNVVINTSAH